MASSFWGCVAKDLANRTLSKRVAGRVFVSSLEHANRDLSKPMKLAHSLLVFSRNFEAFFVMLVVE